MPTRRQLLSSLAAIGAVGAAASCGPKKAEPTETEEETLRMRIWDERAKAAYEESLSAFTASTGIDVVLEVQEWDEYWTALPLDIAAGKGADVYWMNTANLALHQQSGSLLEPERAADLASQWEPSATDLYRLDGSLWGVPQWWNVSMVVANRAITDPVEVDPSGLRFDPAGGNDTLIAAAKAMTLDAGGKRSGEEGFDPATKEIFGFGSQPDRTAVLGPFIAGAGGAWQTEEAFTFASEQGIATVQYLADLGAVHHAAPDGAATVEDPDLCRTSFLEGRLAIWQTGTYDLSALLDGAGDLTWDLHPVVDGPQGRHPLVHAVAAVGVFSDDDERDPRIDELLAWLGGIDSQRGLVATGIGIPAHRDLRGAWEEQWKKEGVDVSGILGDLGETARPETGPRAAEGTSAAMPIIHSVFTGEKPASEALPEAQQEANAVLG